MEPLQSSWSRCKNGSRSAVQDLRVVRGRDTLAGWVIKRITEQSAPRVFRLALTAPTERENHRCI